MKLPALEVSIPKTNFIGKTWLITQEEWRQNRPWVLGTLIYEAVKLERGWRFVWTSP